jgi:hypothetical protein
MGIKQRKWQEHLKAAETAGMGLSAYAAPLCQYDMLHLAPRNQ